MKECKHVFVFRTAFHYKSSDECIKTNIDFFEIARKKLSSPDNNSESDCIHWAEEKVKELYFTPERIQQLKEELCREIMESNNPFTITCVDLDGGYSYEQGELLEDKVDI